MRLAECTTKTVPVGQLTWLFIGLFISIECFGCAHKPLRSDKLALDAIEDRCRPPANWQYSSPLTTQPSGHSSSQTVTSGHFSASSLGLADMLGITSSLRELAELPGHEDKDNLSGRLAFLEGRQQVTERLLLASFDIAGTVAEIDCETSRAEHLANGLEEARDRRIRTLTLVAIVGDALIGILAGGLSLAAEETAAAAAAISGGTIATGFGIAAVFGKTYHEFKHERNLLADIWENPPDSKEFSRLVWKYLTVPSHAGAVPRREALLAHWNREGFLGEAIGVEPIGGTTSVLFSRGGQYEIEDLRTRAVMLDMVKAEVNAMHQELTVLMREVLALQF